MMAFKLAAGLACLWTCLFLFHPLLRCRWTWEGSLQSFKILFIADPQLLGTEHRNRLGPWKGWIDQWFNDLYMRHWFQSLLQTLRPNRVGIMGDLLSAQHLSNDEFQSRMDRFHWIFKNTVCPYMRIDLLAAFTRPLLIRTSGNHDIGYGFDMSKQLVERFERAIGSPLNYEFQAVGHRFIAINAQAVDATNDRDLHEQVWGFIRNRSRLSDTRISDDPIILLTHIPLHKPHGLCNDGPEASYYHENGAVLWQNMQSEEKSRELLRLLSPTFIFNGHDHHGCSTVHSVDGEERVAALDLPLILRRNGSEQRRDIYEITIRSFMAEFNGAAGLFEIRRDTKQPHSVSYSFKSCEFYNHLTVWEGLAVGLVILCAGLAYDLYAILCRSRRGGKFSSVKRRISRRIARQKIE